MGIFDPTLEEKLSHNVPSITGNQCLETHMKRTTSAKKPYLPFVRERVSRTKFPLLVNTLTSSKLLHRISTNNSNSNQRKNNFCINLKNLFFGKKKKKKKKKK